MIESDMTYKPPPFEEFAQEEQQKRALELCERAERLNKKELYDEALKVANQAVELAPDAETESECQIQKGWALIRLRRFDDALIAMRRAIDLTPESPEVHLYLGFVLEALSQWTKALEEFEKASRLNNLERGSRRGEGDTAPDGPGAYDFASLCDRIYPHLGESELKSQVEKFAKGLTAKASDQLKTKLWYAYRYLIKMLAAPGASEETIDHINRLLKAAPFLGSEAETRKFVRFTYERWARLRADKKDYDSALTYYEKASNLNPDPDKSEYEAHRLLLLLPSETDLDSWIRELAKLPQDGLKKIAKYWADWEIWPDAKPEAVLAFLQIGVASLQKGRENFDEWFAKIPQEGQKQIIQLVHKFRPDLDWPPAKPI
jgi:tetratricopeptide (TPR) repeat protein